MTDAAAAPGATLDLAFLDIQTHGDTALAREVLGLFAVQARRLVPSLPGLGARERGETTHLLKGSCQGIGAPRAAVLLQRYEAADEADRRALYPEVSAAFAELEAAIEMYLAAP